MKWVEFVNILNLAVMTEFSLLPLQRFTADYARFKSVFFVHEVSLNVIFGIFYLSDMNLQ